MTSISYEDIFNYFLGNVTDYQIASLSYEDAFSLMIEWLHKALSSANISRLFSDYCLDDEIQKFSFSLECEVKENIDIEFIKNILAKSMVIEWLRPQVRSKLLTSQYFGGKESNFYSQSSHLTQLRGLLEDSELEVERMLTNRDFVYNSYLSEKL